jgi:hypothetical protein
MEQPVADRVGEARVADLVVPFLDRELAGEDGGVVAVAILHDLEQVTALGLGDGDESPVVDDEHVSACEAGEQAGVAAVGAGEGELVEQPRGAAVQRAEAGAAGLLGERAGEVGLAGAGGSG